MKSIGSTEIALITIGLYGKEETAGCWASKSQRKNKGGFSDLYASHHHNGYCFSRLFLACTIVHP